MYWAREKVIEATKDWLNPVTEASSEMAVTAAKKELFTSWMADKNVKKKNATKELIDRLRAAYEAGADMRIMVRDSGLKEDQIIRWARKFHWYDPRSKDKRPNVRGREIFIATSDLEAANERLSTVTEERAEDLPAELQELHEDARLLGIQDNQLDKIPFKKWGRIQRLKIGRLSQRIIQRMELMDDDELLDPQCVKTLQTMSAISEKLEPKEAVSGTGNSVVNSVIMFGMDALPGMEKKTHAKEIPA